MATTNIYRALVEDPDPSTLPVGSADPEPSPAAAPPGTSVSRGTELPAMTAQGMAILQPALEGANRATSEIQAGRLANEQERQAAAGPILGEFEATARTPAPAPPARPPLPEAPAREFRPFLQGVPGEAPMVTLQRMLGGLALVATQAASAFNGTPQVGLAALTGALQGWAAGDQKRGDAEFQTYQAAVERSVLEWQQLRQAYEDALKQRHASLESLGAALRAVNARFDMPKEMYDLADKNVNALLGRVQQWGTTLIQVGMDTDKIAFQREMAEADRGLKAQIQAATMAHQAAVLEQRKQEAADRMAMQEANRADRMQIAQMMDATRREAIAQRADAAANRPGAGGKPLTNPMMSELKTPAEMIGLLDNMLAAYHPSYLGLKQDLTGPARESVSKTMTPAEITFRQSAQQYFNILGALRGGKVLTANEISRLRAEAPTTILSPQAFLTRLANTRAIIAASIPRGAMLYRETGYNIPEDLGVVPERTRRAPTRLDEKMARQFSSTDHDAATLLWAWGFDPRMGAK